MAKAQEYRHQAHAYLELAKKAEDQFTKEAMKELATEFLRAADQLEQQSRPHTRRNASAGG